ncbi:hypothetical protein AMTRI_Chr02g212980 [Amborella trichopoda]
MHRLITDCFRFSSFRMRTIISKFILLISIALLCGVFYHSPFLELKAISNKYFYWVASSSLNDFSLILRSDKFLEVPQIVWGLNNQKIALARACLTARMLNRTLLMPSLSNSLFYKETNLLEPVSFDKVFSFDKFNSQCNGFVRIGRFSDLSNQSQPFVLIKGSGRKWTAERDLDQLQRCRESSIDDYEVIKVVGKNPFLWHDHWPVKDYAKVFECLVLVDEILDEVKRVVTKIRAVGSNGKLKSQTPQKNYHLRNASFEMTPYVAVHMRVEKDWMIHCKKMEARSNMSHICSSKEEIRERVANIPGLRTPVVVYVAVADDLLEDSSILSGWKVGLFPIDKKRLGVWEIYKKYPYLIQSAIDYEVCLGADIFVGNSFSTFSGLIVLERTQKLIKSGISRSCDMDTRWVSYAYNIQGSFGEPKRWMTNMSDLSLNSISYGSNSISC